MSKGKSEFGKSMKVCPRTMRFVTDEEYDRIIDEIKEEKEAVEEAARLAKESRQAYLNLKGLYNYDALDEAIACWKNHKDQDDFTINAMPHIRILNRTLAIKYLVKLPRRYRRLKMDSTETYDHTEWLTMILMEAIEKWKPELLCHFRVFYEQRVKWYYCNCVRNLNSKLMKDIDITFTDWCEEEENMISKSLIDHYMTNNKGQMFMDTSLENFPKTLAKKQQTFYEKLELYVDEKKMTQVECAKHLNIGLSTFKRKREELREAWINYSG